MNTNSEGSPFLPGFEENNSSGDRVIPEATEASPVNKSVEVEKDDGLGFDCEACQDAGCSQCGFGRNKK